jgi:hypothetical protein
MFGSGSAAFYVYRNLDLPSWSCDLNGVHDPIASWLSPPLVIFGAHPSGIAHHKHTLAVTSRYHRVAHAMRPHR